MALEKPYNLRLLLNIENDDINWSELKAFSSNVANLTSEDEYIEKLLVVILSMIMMPTPIMMLTFLKQEQMKLVDLDQ